jgi:hypothetical protein
MLVPFSSLASNPPPFLSPLSMCAQSICN